MIDFFNTYRVAILHFASVLVALAIWRWGRGPERWLIAIYLVTMVAPFYATLLLGLGYLANGPYSWFYFATDLAALAGFVLVALNANRNYPLWIAGFQLVAVGGQAMRGLFDGISLLALLILIVGPSYCQLLLIFGGFLRHRARERRYGSYREWRTPPAQTPLFQV
jgi:heme exporter protein D